MRANPFKSLSSRDTYENAWIRVEEHQVLGPGGKPGVYGVVRFKNRAVGVIPYSNGGIWLVGQHRFPLNRYSWEIPEGGSPEHESLEETARRELREETGLRAETMERLFEVHLSNSVSDEYGIVYLAQGLSRGDASPEETEILELAYVPLSEALARIDSGEITDSLTVAGLLKLRVLELEGKLN